MTGSAILSPADVAVAYFDRLDRGAPELFELFADDFEFYFPKFGIGKGTEDFVACMTGLQGRLESITHYVDRSAVIVAGDKVVVEGLSSGRMKSGEEWHGGVTAGGRFCNVFEIRGGLIERVSVYLDPDYVSEDTERFLWKNRKSQW
ncbi:nuclear transport factor 2 family protein [Paraburkholderia elongata]|uniref:Nuclear transport factor 2 family protein n=1 Tax=Paraburkholderia elongata TaxID=2675747 RepID=A0A972NIA6_9BURK|nr:nuclear transport factor 2 family protein [Paraburkholderia elongata]NPT53214.1 nuclear transport factor 2 family protein [Paraburkholderia elongata]